MRRKRNAYNQQVTLFVGNTHIVIVTNKKQIDFASRTIRLTEKILYTYHTPLTSVTSSQLAYKNKNPNQSLSLQQLVKYEYEYKITTNMRPKLLFSTDKQVQNYLRMLNDKIFKLNNNESYNIVAIAIDDQAGKFINGFIFTQGEAALKFYQSVNQAIASQIYFQLAQTAALPFNYKLSNLLGDVLNGTCVIDPEDFSSNKTEEQVSFVYELLRTISSQLLCNFRKQMFELQLRFKIVDDESKNYACNFISSLQSRVQKLNLSDCELNSNQFNAILHLQPFILMQKLQQLLILDLSNNQLNDDFFNTATNLLRHSKKLHHFNLSHNAVTLQKEGNILSFLQAITKFKIILNLSHNKIRNSQAILKYFINSRGNFPLGLLDISSNCFKAQQVAVIAKSYLESKPVNSSQSDQFKLIINQLQFQDAQSFEFLKMQHRQALPTALSVPLSLSKHPFRKAGKQIIKSDEQLNRFNQIDSLLKKYGTQVFYGNFYKMKKIKHQLIGLGVQQQIIRDDSKQVKELRRTQEQMIIKKFQAVSNFKLKAKNVINDLNQTLIFARRKGLQGQGVSALAFIKFKIQQKLSEWQIEGKLGHPYLQLLFNYQHKYMDLYLNDSDLLQTRSMYPKLVKTSEKDLINLLKQEEGSPNATNTIAYSYLNLQKLPDKIQRPILQQCLIDPLLSTIKIIRDSNLKTITFLQTERIAKVAPFTTKSQIQILSIYGIESYRFNQTFIQSGLSSSGYNGMLSNCRFEVQHENTISRCISIFNYIMELLYQTPDQISDQAISYIISMSEYLIQKQNEKQNDLKSLLVEELIIRIMTYFDSQRHRDLKRGIVLSICEFLLRRVQVEEELLYRLTAYLIKIYTYKLQQLRFHVSASKMPWEGKIDWKVKDPFITKELILSRGKVKVSLADISNQDLQIFMEIDQLQTVADLWVQVKENIQKISEFTCINKSQISYYWLCGTKTHEQNWDFQFLPSYQHIGKLIFQDKFQRKFFLRRLVYPPQFHSLTYLRQMKYSDLVCLFSQVRQNFRQSAHIMFFQNMQTVKLQLTVDIMWIQTLLQEQIMLNMLRRQKNEQGIGKYRGEREKIIGQLLNKLKVKYLPINSNLNEQNKNSLISQVRAKTNEPVPQIISQTIKQNIIKLIVKLGICAFTTNLVDHNNNYAFYYNNKTLCFQDKSQYPAKKQYVQFKHLIWFQPSQHQLKFEIIQNIGQSTLERYRFSIYGSQYFLAQVYSLITNLCNIRASFPIHLLCMMEDNQTGVFDSVLVSQSNYLLPASLLQLSKYFNFTLPRMKKQSQSQQPQQQLPQPLQKKQVKNEQKIQNFKERQQYEPIPNPKIQIKPLQHIVAPISTIPQRSIEQSSKRDSQKNLQIQQILQAAAVKEKQDQQQVITTKRSSQKNASNSRRKSRNR